MENEAFIYTSRGETASEDMLDDLMSHIMAVQQFTFEDSYGRFTEKQKMLLHAKTRICKAINRRIVGKPQLTWTVADFLLSQSL